MKSVGKVIEVVIGIVMFELLETAINKNKSKKDDYNREDTEKELETVRNVRNKAISAKKDAEKGK